MNVENEHHKLVPVFSCGNDFQAEIIIAYLNENGIKAFENSNFPHSVYPVSSDAQILVHEDDAEAAKEILAKAEEQFKMNPESSEEE